MAGDGSLSPSKAKGKAKMDFSSPEEADEGPTCGICLADARRSIRGEVDSCGHHFCFVCIMAWARIESRCPFCKLRFRTIRRPPVLGLFPAERVVAVPERNQVYHPLGNESTAVSDPYANTSCSLCNCSKDDELLLLCELCDSAAHTYCVGLGATVPEGDWFCLDCTKSKEEHSKSQLEGKTSGDDEDSCKNSIEVDRTKPVISIFDIIAEDYTLKTHRTNAQKIRPQRQYEDLPSQNANRAEFQHPESPQEQDNGRTALHAHTLYEVGRGARTLCNSRHLNNRIKALRENWAALRAGSVGFSSHLLNSSKKSGAGTTTGVRENQQCAVPVIEQPTTSSNYGKTVCREDTQDACKAWKMMEMAKSTGGTKRSKKLCSLNCSVLPFSMGNRATSYSSIDTIVGLKNQNISNGLNQKHIEKHDHSKQMQNTPPTKNLQDCHRVPENHHVLVHEKAVSTQDRIVNQTCMSDKIGSSSHSKYVDQTLEHFCGTGRQVKPKPEVLRPPVCSLSCGQSTLTSAQELQPSGESNCTEVYPEEPLVSRTATDYAIDNAATTAKVRDKSAPDHDEHKRKLGSEACDDQSSTKRPSSSKKTKIAKSEISSLVICELKLLRIDKIYGSDRFKEVARAATHTVLAACGLEHSAPLTLAHTRLVCQHSDKIKQLKSSVMTDCCRVCFYNFVKEVISSVLSNRQMDSIV